MSITHARRARSALLQLLIIALLPLGALAAESWIEQVHVRASAGDSYELTQRELSVSGSESRFLPTTELNSWTAGGAITAPIYRGLSGRLLVSGGQDASDRNSARPDFDGSTVDATRIDATGMLFLRDPEYGHLDFGYRFGWEDSSGSALEWERTNALVLEAGFYIPDQGLGLVDWDLFFSYGRGARRTSGATEAVDEYTLGGTMGYYAGSFWRLSAGVRWLVTDPEFNEKVRDLRATAELSWLLPVSIAERRFATFALHGSAGRVVNELSGSPSNTDRGVFSVGCTLTLSFPGASSMVELIREQY